MKSATTHQHIAAHITKLYPRCLIGRCKSLGNVRFLLRRRHSRSKVPIWLVCRTWWSMVASHCCRGRRMMQRCHDALLPSAELEEHASPGQCLDFERKDNLVVLFRLCARDYRNVAGWDSRWKARTRCWVKLFNVSPSAASIAMTSTHGVDRRRQPHKKTDARYTSRSMESQNAQKSPWWTWFRLKSLKPYTCGE